MDEIRAGEWWTLSTGQATQAIGDICFAAVCSLPWFRSSEWLWNSKSHDLTSNASIFDNHHTSYWLLEFTHFSFEAKYTRGATSRCIPIAFWMIKTFLKVETSFQKSKLAPRWGIRSNLHTAQLTNGLAKHSKLDFFIGKASKKRSRSWEGVRKPWMCLAKFIC